MSGYVVNDMSMKDIQCVTIEVEHTETGDFYFMGTQTISGHIG